MLTKKLRFHGHGSLRFLYKNADAYRSRFFTVKAIKNPNRKTSRFAVVVSKKVHKSAVGRNRIRRRIYEVIRHDLPNIIEHQDVAIIVTSGEVVALPHDELVTSLRDLLSQAGLIGVADRP
jgi:ribonuclease P protein component